MTKNIKAVRERRPTLGQIMNGLKMPELSPSSSSDEETKSFNSLQDFVISLDDSLDSLENRIIHAIILPNYMEDIATLRETLDVLASHRKARTQYEVGYELGQTFHIPFDCNCGKTL
jgi:hypothetical protein